MTSFIHLFVCLFVPALGSVWGEGDTWPQGSALPSMGGVLLPCARGKGLIKHLAGGWHETWSPGIQGALCLAQFPQAWSGLRGLWGDWGTSPPTPSLPQLRAFL